MSLIVLKDVSKLYGFGGATTVALDEVNFNVAPGEFVAIMGPSGSGKSTLLHIIGLLDRPTNGLYQLSGKSVERLRPSQRTRARRKQIGFVFQSFHLIPNLSVLENVALPLAYSHKSRAKRLQQASNMLERVGLRDREYYLPRQLSGGQVQRVAIARALVNNPDVIIADEPTGNLDSEASRVVMELLSDLNKTGSTVLIVTHNPELTRYANRVVFMHDGSIIAEEKSSYGDVPELARGLYFMQHRTEEDDMKGVSALMHAIPSKDNKPTKKKKRKSKAKTTRSKKRKTNVKR